MKTVLVTGASGFIGKNLCARLEQEKEVEVLRFGRGNSRDELKKYLGQSDFVFHLAGVNRPENVEEFDVGNRALTEGLLKIAVEIGYKSPILIASSTQAGLDNPYGKSKKAGEEIALRLAQTAGLPIYIYRLPGVFGKWCRPNYNSVVATFCHNIANNKDITIDDPSKQLTLVYIDDVVQEFIKVFRDGSVSTKNTYYDIPRDFKITLQELADKLSIFKEIPQSLFVPSFEDDFSRFLYATYTSYLDSNDLDYGLETKQDERGELAEFIKSAHAGQVFISRTRPGFTRGNHWHNTKVEKFLVLDGLAEVTLRQLNSKEKITYRVSGQKWQVVDIPAGYIHSIKNVGEDDLLTLIWADEIFDQQEPDTYYLEV